MTLNYIPEPHKMVVVYDGEEGGYSVLAHNLNSWDSSRLAKRCREQYELDAHIICHRVRHDGIGDAGQCEFCHGMMDDIIESAQLAGGHAASDDGHGMVS
jgi:hypothetical protein